MNRLGQDGLSPISPSHYIPSPHTHIPFHFLHPTTHLDNGAFPPPLRVLLDSSSFERHVGEHQSFGRERRATWARNLSPQRHSKELSEIKGQVSSQVWCAKLPHSSCRYRATRPDCVDDRNFFQTVMWEPYSSGFHAGVTPLLRDELVVVTPEEANVAKGSASSEMGEPPQFGSHGVSPHWYYRGWTTPV